MATIGPAKAVDKNLIKNPDDALDIRGIHLRQFKEQLKGTDARGKLTDVDLDTLSVDTIQESTSGNGVVIDGVTLKDGGATFTGDLVGATVTGAVKTEVITATNTITAAESGTTYFLNSTTGSAQVLPTAAAGLTYTFIITTVPTSGNMTVTAPTTDDNIIFGYADVNSTQVLAATEDSINFIASTCVIGDWVTVISDGTNWYVKGASQAAGGITFTNA